MKKMNLKKQVFAAMLVCMGYVLSTFVSFPRMAPFQHMINVIAAVFLGPVGSFLTALVIGIMRMILNGRSILAVIGGVVGALLAGLMYRKFKTPIAAVIGEVIGTGILSAILAFPVMKIFYGLPDTSIFTYVPFFIPASFMGAMMGYLLIKVLEKSKLLHKYQTMLQEN
ncbi:MAG: energy coupling factor transporter S component ThiW [Lachnospiraceae bacterium]